MDFDRFSVIFLLTPEQQPDLDEQAAAELQDRHLAFLANLHEAGEVLAAGPAGSPEQLSRRIRGIKLMRREVDEARALAEQDPAVQAGVFELEVIPWVVPAGALHFKQTRFPHSAAEASS